MRNDEGNSEASKRDSKIVGKLTEGVLHDFNNVLQGIIGLAEMLDGDPSIPEKAKISMKAIRRLGQNATKMVQNIHESGGTDSPTASPLSEVEAATESVVTEVPAKFSILVVEDDPLVLRVVTSMLKHLGYSTISASNGIDALEVYNQNQSDIDCVITDMVMPQLGGIALTEKLLAMKPSLKIVMMTGYLQDELDFDMNKLGLAGWLEKPMTAERLRQVIEPIVRGQSLV